MVERLNARAARRLTNKTKRENIFQAIYNAIADEKYNVDIPGYVSDYNAKLLRDLGYSVKQNSYVNKVSCCIGWTGYFDRYGEVRRICEKERKIGLPNNKRKSNANR